MGYLTESFSYDAFGNMLGVRDEFRDAATGGYRFSTKESNTKSGLVYFGARYYDPRIGRFITPDPLTWGPDDERVFERNEHISKLANSYVAHNRGLLDVHPLKLEEILLRTKKFTILTYGALYPNLFLHKYVYCANNPVNYRDLYGNSVFIEIFGIVLAIIGASGVAWFLWQIIAKSWAGTIDLPFLGEGLFETLGGIVYTILKFIYKLYTKGN
jgi:RHS repeat-associated protein